MGLFSAYPCAEVGTRKTSGLRDLAPALQLALPVRDELPALNRAVRRTGSLEQAAQGARDPKATLAYLLAAARVIAVDDFAL